MAAGATLDCLPRDVLAGYLRDRGLALHAWGLTSTGSMHELYLADDGNFVVVETTPRGCVRVVSALDKEGGRLWRPPRRNQLLPPPPLVPGEPA